MIKVSVAKLEESFILAYSKMLKFAFLALHILSPNNEKWIDKVACPFVEKYPKGRKCLLIMN